MPSLGACGSYRPLTDQQASVNGVLSPNIVSLAQPYFFILPPHGPTMPPLVPKKKKNTVIPHVITIRIHPGHSHWPEMVVWPHSARCCPKIPGDCTGLPCRSLGSGVIKIGSDSGSLSISHLRFTQNVYTWCLNVNNLLMGASPYQYQRHHYFRLAATTSISIFRVLYFRIILGHNCGA